MWIGLLLVGLIQYDTFVYRTLPAFAASRSLIGRRAAGAGHGRLGVAERA